MIEFKADCGHVVQVDDGSAGRVVKCAYCGREVQAPGPDEDEPDLLFQEVDLTELAKDAGGSAVSRAITIKGRQKQGKGAPTLENSGAQRYSPLRQVLVFCYVGIGVIVVFFGGRAVVDLLKSEKHAGQPSEVAAESAPLVVEDLPDISLIPRNSPVSKDTTRSPSGDHQLGAAFPEAQQADGGEPVTADPKDRSASPGDRRQDAAQNSDDHENPNAAPQQPSATQPRNPWGPRRSGQTTKPKEPGATAELSSIVDDFASKLRRNQSIDPADWKAVLISGESHAVWRAAEPRDRVAYAELMDASAVTQTIKELGETMLADPDVEVRLAIVEAFARAKAKDAIEFLDRRLDALEETADVNPDRAAHEKTSLEQAKQKIIAAGRKKPRNPWDR